MKRARKINAAIWAVIGVALSVLVCVEWHKQGCGIESLIVGAIFYLSCCTCFCLVADETIKEHYANQY